MMRLLTSSRSPRRRGLRATVILAAVLSAAVAGCGNSQPTVRTTSAPTTPSTTAASTSSPLPATGGRSISAGALRVTLNGKDHKPRVNEPWAYSLKLTNTTGQPLSGTVAIEFLLAGQIVSYDKPPTHPITNGVWQSTLKFPNSALGYPLTLRAIAHTPAGSIAVDWPVTVKR
jgi:hypothetical protein